MTIRKFSLLTASTLANMPTAFASAPPAPGQAPAAAAPTASKPRVDPQLTSVFSGIKMPERTNKRGSTSIFPFDTLANVGDAFGIKNRDAKSLSSIISNANRKAMVNKTDAAGNVVYKTTEIKDANGVVIGQQASTEPEKVAGKRFAAFDVKGNKELTAAIKGTPLEGSTVLVFREA
jgi:hypothetical protein